MRYLIDLSNSHGDVIQEFIKHGRYQSVAAFIQTAIENQIYLESSSQIMPINYSTQFDDKLRGLVGSQTNLDPFLSKDIGHIETVEPPLFSKTMFPAQIKGSDSNEWIWGQVNKIFPLKVALRVLGNMIKQGKKSNVILENFREKAAEIARELGLGLLEIEKRESRSRTEKVSAGLPIGAPEFKSKSRYTNHFLITLRKDGMLDGALAKFKFANIDKLERKKYIGITRGGLEFALLENPIIDKKEYAESLSDGEKDFYLDYVAKELLGEFKAIRWILSVIEKGENRRDAINEALQKKYPEWTEAITNTQRSGLMSRMFELGLLERVKSGVEVTYNISKKGKSILIKTEV